jgi:hypothetical protein
LISRVVETLLIPVMKHDERGDINPEDVLQTGFLKKKSKGQPIKKTSTI